ncbi:hypothetical protein CUJ86_04040 [Methanofollis fontis]|uniref:Uncharacterized protein n=1 Tax=Methanofollis fontis TaxID=2052832 RepID=A0A483CY56_9EURY|nr:hypothetical protein CUJ86_04040 [Methanofollis fontis]
MLLTGSLLITIVLYAVGLPFFFLFLFIPLIPFFGRSQRTKRCPVCGWETTGNENFCPFDGTRLDHSDGE